MLRSVQPSRLKRKTALYFSILADSYQKMTQTASRLELTSILSEVLKQTPKDLVPHVCYLTQGKLHPDFEGIELGMAEKTVSKAVQRAFGTDPSEIQSLLRRTGDLGDVASHLSGRRRQDSLFSEKLTVKKVYDELDSVARTTGAGSIETRINKLAALLNSSEELESKFLTRFVTGKLRLGVADFTVLDALAVAFTNGKENRKRLENAYNLTSDLGYVAQLLVNHGLNAIDNVRVTAGKPVRPMLAERMDSSAEIIERMANRAACEYKLDGERIQGHRSANGDIELYSRRLEKITSQYTDVIRSLQTLRAREFIIEGEVVALSREGNYLPFQELMHRRRKYGLKEAMEDYPVCLNLFDILLLDGKDLIDESYEDRRRVLDLLFNKSKKINKENLQLVPSKVVQNAQEIDTMMEESLSKGCEGLVVKDPRSAYRAGAREFAWIKFKPEYISGVRDTIDLVIVGANHGMGRRAGKYGTFLLAAYDQKADIFRTTTKVGTGFSDADLENLTQLLKQHRIPEKSPRVDAKVESDDWFEPKIVIEVIASEITLSPIYTAGLDAIRSGSGLALRFPKFTGKMRNDKSPEDSTTVSEIVEIYRKQTRQPQKEIPRNADM